MQRTSSITIRPSDPLQTGSDLAESIFPVFHAVSTVLDADGMVHFYSGLLAGLFGAMAADLGQANAAEMIHTIARSCLERGDLVDMAVTKQ